MNVLKNVGLTTLGFAVLAVAVLIGGPFAILTDLKGAVRLCRNMGEDVVRYAKTGHL